MSSTVLGQGAIISRKWCQEVLWVFASSSPTVRWKGLFISCSFLYVCVSCLHIECCVIRLRNIYSEMPIITVLKPRAQLIVIQILETLLWLSFIIMSSIPEVKAAPVVFEESMNMRVWSCNF